MVWYGIVSYGMVLFMCFVCMYCMYRMYCNVMCCYVLLCKVMLFKVICNVMLRANTPFRPHPSCLGKINKGIREYKSPTPVKLYIHFTFIEDLQ